MIEAYDDKKGTLTFAGKKIEISKSGKETNATLLMRSLMKVEGEEWMHNDEILEDWGYREDEQEKVAKNKIYFACQNLNTTLQIKANVDDFLEYNTTKARINPKYRKLDE